MNEKIILSEKIILIMEKKEMKKLLVLLVIGIFVLPFAAQAEYQVGDKELQLIGSGSSDNSFDNTIFATEVSLGYFFTPNLEALIRQGIGVVDTEGGGSDWNGSTRLGVDYHFDLDVWQPYIGVLVGYLYGDTTVESFVAGPEVGVKYFVNNTTFVNFGIEYEFVFEDANDADEAFDDGRFVYVLGVGFKF